MKKEWLTGNKSNYINQSDDYTDIKHDLTKSLYLFFNKLQN